MAQDLRKTPHYEWDRVQKFFDSGHTVQECLDKFGMTRASWHKARLRGALKTSRRLIPLEELLVENRTQTGRRHLKLRLFDAGILENKCYGIGCNINQEWLGKPISLHLEHINGKKFDNRRENLTLLCPNCHSQTGTYGGRNKSCGIGNGSREPPEG